MNFNFSIGQNPQGQYPPQKAQYPPQQGQYPPQQGQFPPQQGQYPPQGQFPPQGFYPPPQGQYPPIPSDQCPPTFGQQPPQGFYPPAPFGQAPPQFQPQQQGTSQPNPHYGRKLPHMVKQSQKVGKDTHFYSTHFDQLEQSQVLKNEFHTPEVYKITVFYTENIVIGLECHYKALGKDNVATVTNRGSFQGYVQSQTIALEFGEHFTEISGRAGDSIDRLLIKTSKGKTLEVGGVGGQPFNNLLPWGHPNIVSIGGSTREYLDSLYVLHN
ncbi:hypothetical protein ABPG72_020289 [Tetrahymena utriculariae]